LLDFSRAVTGNLFFVPSLTFLENVGDDEPAAAAALPAESISAAVRSETPVRDGSLNIGSLKGGPSHE
jgi:porphyrinogen peroxidase